MITEDQTLVIGFLATPSTHGGVSVERIDTHTPMSAAHHGWTAPKALFVRIVP